MDFVFWCFFSYPLNCHYTVTGLESSITDPGEYDIKLKDVKVVVESRDDDEINVSF